MNSILYAVGTFLLISSGVHLGAGEDFRFFVLAILGALTIAGAAA